MKRLTLALSSLLALGACDKTREQFDFSKQAPDEFAIIKRAPLEMPTEYTSLPKPQPGAPRPQEQSPTSQARATLLGDRALPPVATGASQGEAALLQQAGAGLAKPDIRAAVDSETAEIAKEETPAFDRIMGLTGRKVEEYAVEVDPVAETNRMKANKAAGKPVTAGETAVKEE